MPSSSDTTPVSPVSKKAEGVVILITEFVGYMRRWTRE
jgi:hypothetical protein